MGFWCVSNTVDSFIQMKGQMVSKPVPLLSWLLGSLWQWRPLVPTKLGPISSPACLPLNLTLGITEVIISAARWGHYICSSVRSNELLVGDRTLPLTFQPRVCAIFHVLASPWASATSSQSPFTCAQGICQVSRLAIVTFLVKSPYTLNIIQSIKGFLFMGIISIYIYHIWN